MEKLMLFSIVSFYHNIFYPVKERNRHLNFYLLSANAPTLIELKAKSDKGITCICKSKQPI